MKTSFVAALLLHAGAAAAVWTSWGWHQVPASPPRTVEVDIVRQQPAPPQAPSQASLSHRIAPAQPEPPSSPVTATFSAEGNFYPARLPENFTIEYPKEARRGAGQEGDVLVEAEVAETGQVIHVEVRNSSGHGPLDRAALNQLYLTRLHPALVDGRPTASIAQITIKFRLK